MLKTYKITATVQGMREPFVDWYQAENESGARAQWMAEATAEKFPIDRATLTIEERPEKAHLFS